MFYNLRVPVNKQYYKNFIFTNMKFVVCVIALAASAAAHYYQPAPLNPDGTVADLPEVAAAKAHHFAEVESAKARHFAELSRSSGHGYSIPAYTGFTGYSAHYAGPPAPLNHDGTVADTPEVIAAKSYHFAAHAAAHHSSPVIHAAPAYHYPGYYHPYHSFAPLNPDGTVAETPEVRARTIEHFAAHRDALTRHG